MPSVYLSPSTQEYNPTVGGGTEEYYMNLIADAMEPYLAASGVSFTRNTPDMTAMSSVAQSNQGNYDLHLALHSNASPENLRGSQSGADIYYYAPSARGKQAADIIAKNYKEIYPNPEKVRALPNRTFAELRRTKAPAVLAELVYHDNTTDMNWLKNNIPLIARNLSQSVAEFLGVPFVEPKASTQGIVVTQGGRLNIRDKPSMQGKIIGQIPNGSAVVIRGKEGNWYAITYNNINGYTFADYIVVR
ncbi:MAG: peptidoglycan hydrolase [Clostridiales bacterium GWF2_38_85]|nr:MAG: peptidoglycan hydrolase [Clostridiales bacterium GWF2_38_85]